MKPTFLPLLGFLLTLSLGQAAQTERQIVLDAMKLRPSDPWPRGVGHIVWAQPGSSEDAKGYLEPGGSFSPGFATFGISIWIVDHQGKILATSDTIPLEQITQRMAWPSPTGLPTIITETPHYAASWASDTPGVWQLTLVSRTPNLMLLVVRSVGPSGAPMQSLDWNTKRVLINDRWTLSFNQRPGNVQIGPEGSWTPSRHDDDGRIWKSDHGWGFARLPLTEDKPWVITLKDGQPAKTSPLGSFPVRSSLDLEIPSAEFLTCVEAQTAHLLMGLVNQETRPGDPNNYPLNWLRDGAYEITALARAGREEVAKKLCGPFAEQDFFGGFGSEADGPGLALWALGEVSSQVHDKAFDQSLWPHVQRKAALIGEMLSATQPIRKPFAGPIVPAYRAKPDLDLVCDAARDGLIQGRMDWHHPLLYVNAVSYRGLLSAAALATRLKDHKSATLWRTQGTALRVAWNRAVTSPANENERNYICGLYPTYVVADLPAYQQRLQTSCAGWHDSLDQIRGIPVWTYFSLATTHQWLVLGQPDRTWNDLRWFWAHQASKGLYTWWEGSGEENTFGRWENQVRGWVAPPHVTPHYWTAAEMLLLQLDMLVLLDDTGPEPVLVIGAGIPTDWLKQPIKVSGIGTRLGKVDWKWDGAKMTVTVHGTECKVRLGNPFAAHTPLSVRF